MAGGGMHSPHTPLNPPLTMCGAKLADRKNTEDMMDILGLNQAIDKNDQSKWSEMFGACFEKRRW